MSRPEKRIPGGSLPLLFLILLSGYSLHPAAAQPPAGSPLSLSARAVPGAEKDVLTVRVTLVVAPGVHVYSSPEKFGFTFPLKRGLGEPRVVMPPPRKFNGDEGFDGTVVLTLFFPYAGGPGEEWRVRGTLRYQACSDVICYPPSDASFSLSGTIPADVSSPSPASAGSTSATKKEEDRSPFSRGFFTGVILSFLLGLTISLTPCIYPMVGVTVALIGGAGASRGRTIFLTGVYVLGLSLVYAAAGVAVALAGSTAREALHAPWVLLAIGGVFVLLGLSMFDIVTIQTPSSWSGRVQQLTSRLRGSVPGIFLMGVLSAFVVGPCVTGPVAGLILKTAETGDAFRGFVYFFALAWGMSALLFAAGAASGLLPRAGTWMERVKALIGLVLVWAAFYFTRPVLGETVFLAATITAAAFALGVLGLLRVPDRAAGRRALPRFAGGALLMGGLTWYLLGAGGSAEEEKGLAYVDIERVAAESTKPIILDFTSPDCTNCRKISRTVLREPRVRERLSLFTFLKVDFATNRALAEKFGVIGTPAFVFLDSRGKQIGGTVYTSTGREFKERLFAVDPAAYGGE